MSRAAGRAVATHSGLLLLAVLVLLPTMVGGAWFASHENGRYAALIDHFQSAFFAGNLYPRWIPDLYGGYGYPIFCFYQPGFFFFSLPFAFLGRYPLYTLYATTLLLLYLGALGAYRLGTVMSDHRTGVFCAAMFLLTPYLWVDLYVRGDLSELTALLLCPWPLYFLCTITDRVRACRPVNPVVMGLASSLALVVISHPAVALFYVPVVSVIAAWQGLEVGLRWRYYAPVALGIVLGLALSAPYWFTVFQLRGEVALERLTLGYYQAVLHVVAPWQLVSRAWGFGSSVPGDKDTMSFQLGLVHLVLTTVGAIVNRRSRIVQAAYVVYLALIVFMTPVAAWAWSHVGLLRTVQFPWRILSVTASLQILCMAGLGRLSALPVLGRRLGLVFAALLLMGIGWHHDQLAISAPLNATYAMLVHRGERFTTMENFANENEYLPRTVRYPEALVPRRDRIPIVEPFGPAQVEALEGNSPYRISFVVEASQALDVRINQIYFPGWRVLIDGQDVDRATLERRLPVDGRIVVALTTGRHRLEAFFDGPPGWRVRDGVIVLALLLFAVRWKNERVRSVPGAESGAAGNGRRRGVASPSTIVQR